MYFPTIFPQEAVCLGSVFGDLKSADLEFDSRPDHHLDLFQVAAGSTPHLRLYIANWSASDPWKAPMGRGQLSIQVTQHTYLYFAFDNGDMSSPKRHSLFANVCLLFIL